MMATQFVTAISGVQNDVYKALDALVFHLDAKQWTHAGYELGRIEELGNRLAAHARHARDAVHEAAWIDKRAEEEASAGRGEGEE